MLLAIIFAQNSQALKLSEVFSQSLAVNRNLVDQRQILEQAKEHYNQSVAVMLPSLNGSFNYFNLDASAIPASLLGASTAPHQITTKVSLAMPLFRGFRDFAAIDQAKARIIEQKNIFDSAAISLFGDTSAAVYLVLLLENDKTILEEEAALYEKRIKFLKQRAAIGRSRQTEVLSMQVTLASLRAQIEQAGSLIADARARFSIVTGLSSGLRLEDDLEVPAQLVSVEKYVSMIKERPDIKAAQAQLDAAAKNVVIANGAFLPSADLAGNYYFSRPSGTLQNSLWDATFSVSLPIFSGSYNYSKLQEAKSIEKQSVNILEQNKRQTEVSVRAVYQQLQFDLSQVQAYRNAVLLAKQNLEAVSNDYSSGLVTNLDVIAAMTSYEDISRALNKAEYTLKTNYSRLLSLTAMVSLPEGIDR